MVVVVVVMVVVVVVVVMVVVVVVVAASALTDARSSTVGASPWARRSSHFASAASGVRVS